MKKFVLFFAAAVMAVSASAQTVTESKTFDNFYIGINAGVATATKGEARLKHAMPNVGVRLGRYFTPVFGLAAETNLYFKHFDGCTNNTVVNSMNTSLLGTVNLTNWFAGYKGEPRTFELSTLYGFGWGHGFGTPSALTKMDVLTSKLAFDFGFNLGKSKAWQLYIEPAMVWALNGDGYQGVAYNVNNSGLQLNAGLIYRFKNSNGTHHFTLAQLRDQSEIDALNAQINDLRDELSKKPKEVEVVKEVVKEAPAPQEVKVENLVFVTFAQGKSALTADAKKALDAVKEGKHVQIVGTASPEGSKELNDRLSQARADSVAEYLKARGVNVDEATGKGVQGTTSNRLAVVYVK